MFKNLIIIAILATFLYSCGGNTGQEKAANVDETVVVAEPVNLLIVDYDSLVDGLAGQMIVIEGTVDHVCQHGGKRMFLIAEGTDNRVKVVTGENMESFNTDWSGSDIVVTGLVDELRIDETYLQEWENELKMQAEEGDDEGHGEEEDGEHKEGEGNGHEGSSKGEKADQGTHTDGMDQIAKYRQMIKDSSTDHLSFYSVVCDDYQIKEETIEEVIEE
jgi:hypothetical protein